VEGAERSAGDLEGVGRAIAAAEAARNSVDGILNKIRS